MTERAHHAVDLRMPGVGGDQDFHALIPRTIWSRMPAPLVDGIMPLSSAVAPRLPSTRAGRHASRRMRPGDDLERAVVVLGHRRAAFHPVAAVDVAHAEIVVHRGGVDVAADHAVGLVVLGLGRQRLLEGADIVDRVLHLAAWPISTATNRARRACGADALKTRLAVMRELVGLVAQQREPARLRHHQSKMSPCTTR